MIFVSPDEKASFKEALREFSGLTNEEAYVHVFSKRMMVPVPDKPGEYFGNDQRPDMRPSLQKLIAEVPEKGQLFDVGAGAGDVVDFALKDIAKGTVINIEEPNSALVKKYLKKLKDYELKVGTVYEGPLQHYYEGKRQGIFPRLPQNLILAIHMFYHVTDFTQYKIDPLSDLTEAVSFLYSLLVPGASLFIAYADLLDSPKGEAVCGMAEKFFRSQYPNECYADNLISIYQARNELLGTQGTIANILAQRYPHTKPIFHSERHLTHFFGKSLADIAVLGLAGELCPSDDKIFDLAKLEFCIDYVSQHPDRIGLKKEERDIPQKGLWRANQPQVLATITKKIGNNSDTPPSSGVSAM